MEGGTTAIQMIMLPFGHTAASSFLLIRFGGWTATTRRKKRLSECWTGVTTGSRPRRACIAVRTAKGRVRNERPWCTVIEITPPEAAALASGFSWFSHFGAPAPTAVATLSNPQSGAVHFVTAGKKLWRPNTAGRQGSDFHGYRKAQGCHCRAGAGPQGLYRRPAGLASRFSDWPSGIREQKWRPGW